MREPISDATTLEAYSRTLPEVKDYFIGTPLLDFPVFSNIILFSRLDTDFLTRRESFHHRFVLVFNLQAQGNVIVDNIAHRFVPGKAILIFPHQFHSFSGIADQEINWLFITFEAARFDCILHLRDRLLHMPEGCGRLLLELAEVNSRPSHADAGYRANRMTLLTTLLLLETAHANQHAARAGGSLRKGTPPVLPESISAVTAYVYAHRDARLSMRECAREANLSESRLRAVFKEHVGVSLGRYVQEVKMSKAREMLGSTASSVKVIADTLGFGSVYAFSRAFKAKTGVSPRGYRRKTVRPQDD